MTNSEIVKIAYENLAKSEVTLEDYFSDLREFDRYQEGIIIENYDKQMEKNYGNFRNSR